MVSGASCRSLTGKAGFCITSGSAEADWEISNCRPDCKLTTTIASMLWIPSIAASRYFTTTRPQEQLTGVSNEVDLRLLAEPQCIRREASAAPSATHPIADWEEHLRYGTRRCRSRPILRIPVRP